MPQDLDKPNSNLALWNFQKTSNANSTLGKDAEHISAKNFTNLNVSFQTDIICLDRNKFHKNINQGALLCNTYNYCSFVLTKTLIA